ncbi:ABC transporter substrate-binding protein [Klugiella xanthotipulae]|uniref:Peptide/nickel transport system substrate-binding protein n=1 Tax=Klugiella xanthotipulae TaxID=244735 RepID=A0A543I403_9MICO|nr:ABC transporter substrate-binding protein [Klugiella xanthotipulae]TQM65322.1 peptide/nickel transport system substrate-binding protein [Klugiella xanthotipulae]
MKKLSLTLLASVTAATMFLSGCAGGGAGVDGGTDASIAIGSLYEPQNLDNTAGGGQGVTEAFNGNVYEGLFTLTDEGAVEPLLADSFTTSDDGLTYTVTLREGITFHSGKKLTSADVKSSMERVVAEDSKSARKSSFDVVESIETPDDSTVVYHLSTPSISFPYNLSYIWVINGEAKDLTSTEDGTGPYTLGTWKRGNSLSLERWDDYWGSPATNGEVVFTYFTDATALSNALLTNAVDIVTTVQSPDALTQFENNSDYVVSEGNSTTKELLAFNDRVAPFDNAEVRAALYSAINREKLLTSIWGDYGTLIGSMVPPTDPWYEDLTQVNPYSVDRAKQKLADAGYGDGFTFTLDTPNYDPHPAVAEFVKGELARVGVTMNINVITPDEWYTKVFTERDFEATLQEHVNDRDVVWYGNPDFYWGYDNPQVTTWVTEAEQADSTDEQTATLKLVNEQIAKDAASLWLYLYPQIVVAGSDVTGYPVNGLNSQFFAYNIVKE